MGKPTTWDKIKNWINYVFWSLYRSVVLKMTEKEYYSLSECPFCGAKVEPLTQDDEGAE